MTSIFDQFNEDYPPSKVDGINIEEISNLGYMKVESDTPIFQKIKKSIVFPDKVTHACIANKHLIVAMPSNGGRLLRINLRTGTQDEITLSKYTSGCRLTNVFLDPTGNHVLLTFAAKTVKDAPELLYLSRKLAKLKSTTKFKGHEFTEIGWNHGNDSEITTGPILLGTTKGLIFETEIVLEGENFFTSGFSSSLEQYWRQLPNYLPLYGNKEVEGLVFDIGKGTDIPINGIEFGSIPLTDKYFVLVATPSRLFYFKGKINPEEKPLLSQVFNRYLNIPEENTCYNIETSSKYSKLKVWLEKNNGPVKTFTWRTSSGILFGEINALHQNEEKNVKEVINESTQMIAYPKPEYVDHSSFVKLPFNLVMTEFHVLLAYADSIKGVSTLNKELMYEDSYNEAFGKLVNIIKDPITDFIWAITETNLFKFVINREHRHVWQHYCNRHEFELAKKYSVDDEMHYNQVLIKEAEVLFEKGQYTESAQSYAETESRFEEVCLKFIQSEKLDALKVFLCRKLGKLEPQEQTQITMLVLWIVELYLNELEEMRLHSKEQHSSYFELQKEFEMFLSSEQVMGSVQKNKPTIYNLMASHGDKKNLMKLTIINKDFEQLIRQHIYNADYCEALSVLKGQNNRELFYQFAPILLQEIPGHTVKALIEQGKNLSPLRFLPALVGCQEEHQTKEVIQYLEYCTGKLKNVDKAIHNLLLSLYVKHDEKKLMEYLNSQGQDVMIYYDVYFALRLCQEKKRNKACVKLSAILELWEYAIDLALEDKDLELAQQVANMPQQSDVELRKKLWLKIAKHVITGKDNVKEAVNFLNQCELLRIEDILPYFSDSVTIDNFRTAVCESLKKYNQNIQDLKEEMEEVTKSAEVVRKEIQSFRGRYTFIESTDKCNICELTLMVRPFYMFPCGHRFHSDCLIKVLTPELGSNKKDRLVDLQRQLNILNAQSIDNVSTGSSGISAKDVVKADIDNIVASECLYCGEIMIRNIDKPFIDDCEYEDIMKEWE